MEVKKERVWLKSVGNFRVEEGWIEFWVDERDRVVRMELQGRSVENYWAGLAVMLRRGLDLAGVERIRENMTGVDDLVETYYFASEKEYCRL